MTSYTIYNFLHRCFMV